AGHPSSWPVPPRWERGIRQICAVFDRHLHLSETGLNAANELKKKAWQKGVLTQVLIPPIPTSLGVKSWDWNDVLNVYGAMGFPKVHI
ncbi:MAG: hypothetical protein AB2813_10000, partial [Candidatus Sedimenticola endophacoides]